MHNIPPIEISRQYRLCTPITGFHIPSLKYGELVRSTQYQYDIDAVEGILRSAARMVTGLSHLDDDTRLKALLLPT